MNSGGDFSAVRPMFIPKTYVVATSAGQQHEVQLREFVNSGISVFTWPSALVLAAYIAANPQLVVNKRILELGAGTALPSMVAALCGAKSVTITERDAEPEVISNIESTIAANGMEHVCSARALDWSAPWVQEVDVVLGADLLYSTEHFDALLGAAAALLAASPGAVFVTTYQERSNRRTLRPYLLKYALRGNVVPLSSFMHHAHADGECLFVRAVDGREEPRRLESFHSISLIVIRAK